MSDSVSVFQLQSPASSNGAFLQTPIYIGTAAKAITVSSKPGVFSLAIPQSPTGTKYISNSLDTTIKYWKNIGEYNVTKLSSDGLSLTLQSKTINYNPSVNELTNCVIFVIENNILTQTSYVLNCGMAFSGDSLILKDVRLTHKLNPIGNNATVILGQIVTIHNSDFLESDDTIHILQLPNQLSIPGISPIVESIYKFFYRVTDYRITTLNYNDDIPEEYTYPKYSSLARLVTRHRATTNTPMTLCTLVEENVEDLLTVLDKIELKTNAYGYALVPAFYNDSVGNVLKSFVTNLEKTNTAFMITYIWEPLKEETVLVSANCVSQE